eukprot:TRINITY_DN3386_c0_g2_i1.p1 TRINITY_DN3386_c0_g2~~TRINITY_DN3386_c0_g2_i1.p1  ORF type:complete len:220 (+),score=39.49 TRINITY_DN3386_c0_g2_i1:64-660(+)
MKAIVMMKCPSVDGSIDESVGAPSSPGSCSVRSRSLDRCGGWRDVGRRCASLDQGYRRVLVCTDDEDDDGTASMGNSFYHEEDTAEDENGGVVPLTEPEVDKILLSKVAPSSCTIKGEIRHLKKAQKSFSATPTQEGLNPHACEWTPESAGLSTPPKNSLGTSKNKTPLTLEQWSFPSNASPTVPPQGWMPPTASWRR